MDIGSLTPQQLYNIPALKPPTYIHHPPDFDNPGVDGSNARQTIIALGFLLALTVTIVLMRLYTKLVVLKTHGWDDYTAVFATIGAITYSSLVLYLFHHGYGVHQWNVRASTVLGLTKHLNTILYIYKPFLLSAKLSLCIFFFKVFAHKRSLRYAIYGVAAYNTLLQVAAFFLAIFLCLPDRPTFFTCSSRVSVLNIATSACNIFGDLWLLLLPLFGIKPLQMAKKRKIGISLVFGIGFLTCLSSILGLIYRIKQNASPDVTWNFAPEIILVTFELEATIIVSCALLLASFRGFRAAGSSARKGSEDASSQDASLHETRREYFEMGTTHSKN